VGDVGVTALARSLDVWFDNFFTDIGAQSRLKDADRRLSEVAGLLVDVSDAPETRRLEVEERIGT
jgi:hypothetical protein